MQTDSNQSATKDHGPGGMKEALKVGQTSTGLEEVPVEFQSQGLQRH